MSDTRAGPDVDAGGTARWLRVARGTVNQVRVDNVVLLAGGVAFYAMLALVPALGAAVSLYGLVVSPARASSQIASLTTTLPPAAQQLLATQLKTITATSPGGLQLSFAAGLVVALWSASSGMRWLLTALTAASGEVESRKFLKLRGLAMLLTIGAILALGVSLGALLALPGLLDRLGLQGVGRLSVSMVRFPALAALMISGLAVLYRIGPDRPRRSVTGPDRPRRPVTGPDRPRRSVTGPDRPRRSVTGPDREPGRRRWVTWGSVVAATGWALGSVGLSIYATNATKFRAAGTYGALGAVVVLLLWLWMSSFAVILGAVVNTQVAAMRATASPEASVPLAATTAGPQ